MDRWDRIQKMNQVIWDRWSKEYLVTLQERNKWLRPISNNTVGDLVALKDEGLPSLKWKIGKICKVHPGKDGVIRRVTVKTKFGEFERPVHNLVLLICAEELELDDSIKIAFSDIKL